MEQEKGPSFSLAIWYTCSSHSIPCAKLGLDLDCKRNVRSKSRSSVVNDSKHEKRFGLGLNEFAGYISVAIVGFLTGYIAAAYGLKPYPFYLGIAFSLLGFIISVTLVKDTSRFTELELRQDKEEIENDNLNFKQVFIETSWKNRSLLASESSGASII